jgi:FO synthase
MNESITRAAGADHGQEWSPAFIESVAKSQGRKAQQRSTVYGEVSTERMQTGREALPLTEIINTPAKKYERKTRNADLVRNEVIAKSH